METSEQGGPTPSQQRKIQPHQIALWLAVGFLVLSFLSPFLFGSSFLEGLMGYAAYLMIPATWVVRFCGFGPALSFIVLMIWGLIVLYFAFYFLVKLWVTSSKHLRIVLLIYIILCFGTYQIFLWYSTRMDWTSSGLNPDRAGFKPQVLVLSGDFDYWFNDASIAQTKSGKAFFEIRMRGYDYYYCRKWKGNEWKVGSWFRVEIANHGDSYSWGLASLSHTTRGTGGSFAGDKDSIVVARRLWNGEALEGANDNDLVATEKLWRHRTEEFSDLVKVGQWNIPTHIRLTDGKERVERVENYFVRKIEFQATPGTNWFNRILDKYSRRDPELRLKDLDEPGVKPGKRP